MSAMLIDGDSKIGEGHGLLGRQLCSARVNTDTTKNEDRSVSA